MNRSALPFTVASFAADTPPSGETVSEPEAAEDASQESPGDADPQDEGDTPPVEGEEHLGDPGKKALDRMKAQLKAERAKNRELRAKYEPEPDAPTDGTGKLREKILRTEIRVAAAKDFNDPADAPRFLDLEQFEVTEDGDVDEGAISDAVADLLREKPYLGAQREQPRRRGSLEGGVRKESVPAQLSRADLARMTPQAILNAEAQGLLTEMKRGN